MAKATARGMHLIREWITESDLGHGTCRQKWQLRSDGALLNRLVWSTSSGDRINHTNGYTIRYRIKSVSPDAVERFLINKLACQIVASK